MTVPLNIEYRATVPDEPPKMSVVVDAKGRAWQRLGGMFGHEWVRTTTPAMGIATDEPPQQSWPALLVYFAPVRLVYLPPTEE